MNKVINGVVRTIEPYADLHGADLSDACLRRVNLNDANLSKADLRGADLSGADLIDINLSGADMRQAYLCGANLRGANLCRADLRDANLRGADLVAANLHGANLTGADLSHYKNDIWAILNAAPYEVEGLLSALRAGNIDGSCYVGSCACLVGTLAKLQAVSHEELEGIKPNPNRPAERWFVGIRPGATPENNKYAEMAEAWIVEWLNLPVVKLALSAKKG